MKVHTAYAPQQDLERTSTAGRAVIQEHAPGIETRSSSSLLPSSSLQQSTSHRQPRINETAHPHKTRPHGQLTLGGARSSQEASRQSHHPHSLTPVPQQGLGTSHSVSQVGPGPTPVNSTASAFNFRVPSQMSYPVPRTSQNHHDRRQMPTGYASHGLHPAAEAFTQPSAQTSDQTSVAPPRSST